MNQVNINTFEIEIPAGNDITLREKFQKIVNKCKRYKVALPTYEKVGDPFYRTITTENVNESSVEEILLQKFTFTVPDRVAVDNIEFKIIGRFTPTEKGNLIENYTKKDFDASLRQKDLICEHCNTKRNRNYYWYIEKAGERKVLGKNCLQDYFGLNPERIIKNASWYKELQEEFEGYRGFKPQPSLVEFLSYVDFVVEREGKFVPTSKATERCDSTVGQVQNILYYPDPVLQAQHPELFPTHKQLDARKDKIVSLIKRARKDIKPTSEWSSNLKVAIDLDYVVERSQGLVASVYAWLEYDNKQKEKKESAEKEEKIDYSNEHFGETSKKIVDGYNYYGQVSHYDTEAGGRYENIKLKVVSIFEHSDFFIVKLINENKDSLTWFNRKVLECEIGDEIVVNFRVQKHDEYKGLKTTIIKGVHIKKEKDRKCT